jgi:hypothetical protein
VTAHERAAARLLALLDDQDLPAPDRVEYEAGEVWFFWEEPKVAVAVEVPPEVEG